MGVQGIRVREVPGLIPGEPAFYGVSVKNEIDSRLDSKPGLGLNKSLCNYCKNTVKITESDALRIIISL